MTAVDHWSLGGGAQIEVASGWLSPGTLLVEPYQAILDASFVSAQQRAPRRDGHRLAIPTPDLGELGIIDDRGVRYVARVLSASGAWRQSGEASGSTQLKIAFSPVPDRGIAWLELRGENGSVTRLVHAARVEVQVGPAVPITDSELERELTARALYLIELRLMQSDLPIEGTGRSVTELQHADALDAGSELPTQLARLSSSLRGSRRVPGLLPSWQGMLDAAQKTDGPRRHIDLGATFGLEGSTLRLDSLVSEPHEWRLHLGAEPGWWRYGENRQTKRDIASIQPEDDHGNTYVSRFGGSRGHFGHGHEDVTLIFRPRLDPRARSMKLLVQGFDEQVLISLDLEHFGK